MLIEALARSPRHAPAKGLVKLLDVDPELGEGLGGERLEAARRLLVARTTTLEPGSWTPPVPDPDRAHGVMGLLVLEGLLTRCIAFDQLRCPELLGAGDVLRPWDELSGAQTLAYETEWCVLEPTSIALLDARVAAVASRFPTITAALLARALQRSRWLSFHHAIAQMRRAEPRVKLLLWQFADRWGRVTPEGIVVPFALTHKLIGQMVCLRRPTVSLALQRLGEAGEITRRSDRCWILHGAPPDPAGAMAGEPPATG